MRNRRNENEIRQQRVTQLPYIGGEAGTLLKEGILTGDLDPSTNDGETETTASFEEYTGTGASWAAAGIFHTATNRNDGIRMVSGSYILAVKINEEWRPIHACEPRNEFWAFDLIGGESGGLFTVTFSINGTQDSFTLDWDATASEIKTAFETHSEIATDDVSVSGGPFPTSTVIVEFVNNLAAKEIDHPIINRNGLQPYAGSGVVFSRYPGSPY